MAFLQLLNRTDGQRGEGLRMLSVSTASSAKILKSDPASVLGQRRPELREPAFLQLPKSAIFT